jgi:hypothetical protein
VAELVDARFLERTGSRGMAEPSELKINDVVVSKVPEGHQLLIVTALPWDRLSLRYRGNEWSVQYAVARGARLASNKGGDLWYTSDEAASLQYLETFRGDRPVAH